MGHQPEFGVQSVVEFIFTVIYLSLIEVLLDFPTKSTISKKLDLKSKIKKSAKFLQKKDICALPKFCTC